MAELKYDKKTGRVLFTKQMKKEYTILMPNMAHIHFNILQNGFTHYGYKSELLNTTVEIAQTGLKYVHNIAILRCLLSDSLSTLCKAASMTFTKLRL